ncbi:MAG: hypothetical protein M1814_004577 [Vezdaea aestivalis]|nr:MAG: hypothetical protein M1814_004577 [Vezdaea aestivalis]
MSDSILRSHHEYPTDDSLLQPPQVEGTTLRFDFLPQTLPSLVLKPILSLKDSYGFNKANGLKDPNNISSGKKKVIVEFSSSNIAKEFHVGHLRSTIIGGFLSNLYESAGMASLLWGGSGYGDEAAFEANPIKNLFEIYTKTNADFAPVEEKYKAATKRGEDTATMESTGLFGEVKTYFKRMEEGDEEALSLWRRFRSLSIEKYKITYARLSIVFNVYAGKSQVSTEKMVLAETILREKGISEIDQGAVVINFKKHGAPKLALAIIRNRNGTTNYLLQDIGQAIRRMEEYDMDRSIYVVMSEQGMHLQRLFKILELMGGKYAELSKKMEHVSFGKIMRMSTRRGTVKFLDDILADVGEHMHGVMRQNDAKYREVHDPESVADILGISSVVVRDMAGKRTNDYAFDLERITSFDGDTGPYVQYAHSRLSSISRKVDLTQDDLMNADLSLLQEKHAIDLIRLMAQFPDTVNQTLKTLEPTTILTYLFRLTHQLSSSYDVLRVVGAAGGREVTVARAALYQAAKQVIYNCMKLLGLNPLEQYFQTSPTA